MHKNLNSSRHVPRREAQKKRATQVALNAGECPSHGLRAALVSMHLLMHLCAACPLTVFIVAHHLRSVNNFFKKIWLFSVSLNQRLPPWAVPNCGFLSGFVRYPLRSPTVIILYYGITKVNYFWEKILNRPDRSGAEEKCELIKFFKTRLVSLEHEALNAKARGLPSLNRYRLHTLRSRSARR